MTKRMKILVASCVVAALVLVAVTTRSYYLRDDSAGQLVWKTNEAYLFVMVARRGYSLSYFHYPWEALKEWLRVPTVPTNERVFLTVIRVTPSGTEQHLASVADTAGKIPDFFTPVEETIYANCQGALCKWTGDHFETATEDEQTMMNGINHLSPDIDTKIDGWSKKGVGSVVGESQFSIQIDQDLALLVRQGNINTSATESAKVELQRAGQAPQPLWHVNGEPRRVSKKDYERAFSPTGTEMSLLLP
jgi:hypothetical protein